MFIWQCLNYSFIWKDNFIDKTPLLIVFLAALWVCHPSAFWPPLFPGRNLTEEPCTSWVTPVCFQDSLSLSLDSFVMMYLDVDLLDFVLKFTDCFLLPTQICCWAFLVTFSTLVIVFFNDKISVWFLLIISLIDILYLLRHFSFCFLQFFVLTLLQL